MGLFKIESEHFGGEVKVIRSTTFEDNRGFFEPVYREDEMSALGLPKFVQDNRSVSRSGVLRGLHFQRGMGKLMSVTRGEAYMVTVDIRPESPTFLKHHSTYLRNTGIQIWAPEGFARGYYILQDDTEIRYKCSGYFDAEEDKAIRWDSVGIPWPPLWLFTRPILSERDRTAPKATEYFETWCILK
jgi:dTDP-4-dehydrorhamnose 3,5-epimerase